MARQFFTKIRRQKQPPVTSSIVSSGRVSVHAPAFYVGANITKSAYVARKLREATGSHPVVEYGKSGKIVRVVFISFFVNK